MHPAEQESRCLTEKQICQISPPLNPRGLRSRNTCVFITVTIFYTNIVPFFLIISKCANWLGDFLLFSLKRFINAFHFHTVPSLAFSETIHLSRKITWLETGNCGFESTNLYTLNLNFPIDKVELIMLALRIVLRIK